MQAGFDQKETEREAKMKETLSNLQRIFPGPHKSLISFKELMFTNWAQVFAAG